MDEKRNLTDCNIALSKHARQELENILGCIPHYKRIRECIKNAEQITCIEMWKMKYKVGLCADKEVDSIYLRPNERFLSDKAVVFVLQESQEVKGDFVWVTTYHKEKIRHLPTLRAGDEKDENRKRYARREKKKHHKKHPSD